MLCGQRARRGLKRWPGNLGVPQLWLMQQRGSATHSVYAPHLQRLLRLCHDRRAAVSSAQPQCKDDHAPATAQATRVRRHSLAAHARQQAAVRKAVSAAAGQRSAGDAPPTATPSCNAQHGTPA
jgi:hypothetical protein